MYVCMHACMYRILLFICVDITFFSAGFYELDSSNTNVGRDFNITFHDVVYNNGTLTMTDRINVRKDPLWLNCKFIFIHT